MGVVYRARDTRLERQVVLKFLPDEACQDASRLARLVELIEDEQITGSQAREVFAEMVASGRNAEDVVAEKGFEPMADDGAIDLLCDRVISENPGPVAEKLAAMGIPVLGTIPFDKCLVEADLAGKPPIDVDCPAVQSIRKIKAKLEEMFGEKKE